MTKKINSVGKSLAFTTFWPSLFQHYGNSYFLFTNYFLILILLKYLFKKFFIFKKKPSNTQLKFLVFSNNFLIYFSNNFLDKLWLKNFNKFFFQLWLKNFNFLPFHIFIFLNKFLYLSSEFLWEYILFLTKNFNFSPKKIFNLMILFLTKNLKYSILFLTKNGLLRKYFVGFKIQIKGRYESSKTSMSKKLSTKFGKMTLTNLKISTNFINYSFYTKLGISNLKIWIFYK